MTSAIDREITHILMLLGDTIDKNRRSGIQRVAVETARGLANQVLFDLVRWDLLEGRLRFLDADELDRVFGAGAWPEGVKVRPDARALGRPFREQLQNPTSTWLLVPEIAWQCLHGLDMFARAVAHCRDWGGRIAFIFYDLIPIRNPAYKSISAQHEAYVSGLLHGDLIVPISVTVAQELVELWRCRDIEHPPVAPLLLPDGGFHSRVRPASAPVRKHNNIAMVGTIEPRKRQVEFLKAMDIARRASPAVALYDVTVVGSLHPDVAEAFNTLVARHSWIKHLDYVGEAELQRVFRDADFTVFASSDEGYGLPISESLALGTPCLCANFGSMAEIAAGGGCLTVDVSDTATLQAALTKLCEQPDILDRLRLEIGARHFQDWTDYGGKLIALIQQYSEPEPPDILDGRDSSYYSAGSCDDDLFPVLACSDVVFFQDHEARSAFIAEARRRRWPDLLPTRLPLSSSPVMSPTTRQERAMRHNIAKSELAYAKARQAVALTSLTEPVLLRILISTFNRSAFVVANVRWLLKKIINIKDLSVELVVVDGGSTDDTVGMLRRISDANFRLIESPVNVGMLSGLREASRIPGAEYVWLVGDDDYIDPSQFNSILSALKENIGIPFIFTNFSVYNRKYLASGDFVSQLIRESVPVSAAPLSSRRLKVREAAEQTDNLFTAIYAIIWRSDLLSAAYEHKFDGKPFTNLIEAIPCTDFILRRYAECECYWHGISAISANSHNSWSRYRPLWHGLIMPLAFELARDAGVNPTLLQSWADMHLRLLGEAMGLAGRSDYVEDLGEEDVHRAHAVFRTQLAEVQPR